MHMNLHRSYTALLAPVLLLQILVLVLFDAPIMERSVSPATAATMPSDGVSVTIQSIGDPIPVWNSVDTWKKCRMIDVPDIPARAFVGNTVTTDFDSDTASMPTIHMICGAVEYHEMHGPSLLNQTRSCSTTWNATKDGEPSHFAANEFIDSTIRFDNGTVVALIHTEFPGDRYNACAMMADEWGEDESTQQLGQWHRHRRRLVDNLRSLPGPLMYPSCWMVTVGLGVSYDWGHTWQHIAPPPHHLVAAVPYTYNQQYLAYGWGDPSNIVKNPGDGFYYATIWNRNQVGIQGPGICVIRTNDLMNPKSWRA
jgi:hypothetical protein